MLEPGGPPRQTPKVIKRTPTNPGSSARPSTESGSPSTGGLSPLTTHNDVPGTDIAGAGIAGDESPVPVSPYSDSDESMADAYDNAMTPVTLIAKAASYVSQALIRFQNGKQRNDPHVQELNELTVRLDALLRLLKAGDSALARNSEFGPSPGGKPGAGTSPSSLDNDDDVNIWKCSAAPPGPAPPSSVDGYPSEPAVPQSKVALPKGSQAVGLMITRLIEAADNALSAFMLTKRQKKHKEKNPVYKNLKAAKASALAAQDANDPTFVPNQKTVTSAANPPDAGNESCSE